MTLFNDEDTKLSSMIRPAREQSIKTCQNEDYITNPKPKFVYILAQVPQPLLQWLNSNSPPPPNPPSNRPNHNRNHNTNRTTHSPEPKAPPPMTLSIGSCATRIHGILISARIHNTPKRRPGRRDHSHDSPVRAEVLDAPNDGDDDGDEGEGAAIAEANKSGSYVGEAWVLEWEGGGEEKVS